MQEVVFEGQDRIIAVSPAIGNLVDGKWMSIEDVVNEWDLTGSGKYIMSVNAVTGERI